MKAVLILISLTEIITWLIEYKWVRIICGEGGRMGLHQEKQLTGVCRRYKIKQAFYVILCYTLRLAFLDATLAFFYVNM